MFALFAVTAGTTTVTGLVNMSLYLVLFLLGTAVLAFWVLPALISALAPVGHREVIVELRSALAIAAVTTLSVAALPFVMEATRKLADRCGIADPERDEIIRTNLSVAYPLGQIGNFFVYLFLVFAAYYYKVPLEGRDQALLPLMTLLSGFGSPTSAVNAVEFLSAWLALPGGTRELYVELQTLTRYCQVIVSVMAFAFLSVLVTLAYYGKLELRLPRLAAALVLPALAFVAIAWAGHGLHGYFAAPAGIRYGALTLDPAVTRGVEATVLRGAEPERVPAPAASGTTMERIQQSGALRVGYNANAVPFSYFNDAGELVGYDVAFAYDLARSLNVRVIFVPFEWPALERDLEAGRFDIAMAGVYASTQRLSALSSSMSYNQSPVALFMPTDRAHRFHTRDGYPRHARAAPRDERRSGAAPALAAPVSERPDRHAARLSDPAGLLQGGRRDLDARAGRRARPLAPWHHRGGAAGPGQPVPVELLHAARIGSDGALRELLDGAAPGRRHARARVRLLDPGTAAGATRRAGASCAMCCTGRTERRPCACVGGGHIGASRAVSMSYWTEFMRRQKAPKRDARDDSVGH